MSASDVVSAAGTTIPASIFVSGISWGFTTSLYSVCTHNLARNLRSTKARKKTFLLIAWISLLWTLSSLSTMIYAYYNIYAYSWELEYPGGPVVYLADIWNQPLPVLAYATNICTMWLADAILLWRVVVFCHGFDRLTRRLVLSLVFSLYISVVGAGCMMLGVYTSGIGLFSTLGKQAAIPCLALSMTLDLFVTLFISIRLLLFRKLLERTLGAYIQCKKAYYLLIIE
ncbi:hypothetical protein JVU11DRAFT_2394 [Chiua virens]|nr:hypothetical protein JVU11DRAFT_2394 [Chiua virens]